MRLFKTLALVFFCFGCCDEQVEKKCCCCQCKIQPEVKTVYVTKSSSYPWGAFFDAFQPVTPSR